MRYTLWQVTKKQIEIKSGHSSYYVEIMETDHIASIPADNIVEAEIILQNYMTLGYQYLITIERI